MIIVWISVAIIVGSLIYLAITSFQTFKETKPTITEIQATVTRIQQQTNTIKHETNRHTETQQAIMSDEEYKKSAIDYRNNKKKNILPAAKKLWESTPAAKLVPDKKRLI